MEDEQNITIRKPIAKARSLENIDISMNTSTSSELLNRSLDLSTNLMLIHTEEMKTEINTLKRHLDNTQNKLDNIILENIELKDQVTQLRQELQLIKQISKSPVSSRRANVLSQSKNCVKRQLSEKFSNNHRTLQDQHMATEQLRETTEPERAKAELVNVTLVENQNRQHSLRSLDCEKPQKQNQVSKAKINSLDTSPHTPQNKTTETTTTDKPNLLILGGQQCTGLASQLIRSRFQSKYEDYHITSFTKPNAMSEEILAPSCKFKDSLDNCLIACVGENDTNPFKVITELSAMLKRIQKSRVVIINVLYNKSLNEKMLNNLINNVCQNFDNCTFMKIHNYKKCSYFTEICSKINNIVDNDYYRKKYLQYNCQNNLNYNFNTSSALPKKGTIPFYFKTINTQSKAATDKSDIFFREEAFCRNK